MFFTLILENSTRDRIDMTATANQYMTSKIEGLSPPPGTISTSSYAGMDGSYLNNAFIEKRNVVISFEMRGVGIEARRHQLYKVVKPSRYIKIYYATAGIDVFAEGYVESCEVQNFEMLTTGQISILCPDIYWYSTTSVMAYYSQITGAFTFPFPTDGNPEPFITSVTLPATLTTLGTYIFMGCTSLRTARVECSEVPRFCFVQSGLTSLTLSHNVTKLCSNMINYTPLTEIIYAGSLADWAAVTKQSNWDGNSGQAPGNMHKVICLDGYMQYNTETGEWTEVRE